MNAGKKRKLILFSTLASLARMQDLGIPLVRIMHTVGVADLLSRPAAAKLVDTYNDYLYSTADIAAVIEASLNPPWLDPKGPLVQEQPEDWTYVGKFPAGQWVQLKQVNQE